MPDKRFIMNKKQDNDVKRLNGINGTKFQLLDINSNDNYLRAQFLGRSNQDKAYACWASNVVL